MRIPDEFVQQGADLTVPLRAWLRARRESTPVIASALAWELAALIARDADSRAAANRLIDDLAQTMKEQVRRLGIGHEHP